MKKEIKIGLLCLLFIISGLVTYYLSYKELITYAIVTGTVGFIVSILIIFLLFFYHEGVEEDYQRELKQILKVYDSILVESENLPRLTEKNVIYITSMKELVDAQLEIRKPIYYKILPNTCTFVLLDQDEALIYTFTSN